MSPEVTSDRLRLARRLLGAGNPAGAVALVDEIDADTDDAAERAWALLVRMAAVIGLEWTNEYASTVDRAHAAVRAFGDVTALASFHALAALIANTMGSIEQCVTHLIKSSRTLNRLEQPQWEAAVAWHNIAVAYSYVGFHGHATQAASQARDLAAATGMDWRGRLPEVQVRHALSLDHQGDTDGCVRILRALLSMAERLPPREDGLPGIGTMDIPWIGYAAARLTVLGEATTVDALRCLAAGSDDAWTADLNQLGRICLSIHEGETDRARRLLDNATAAAAVLSPAEVPRLRALSHLADGDTRSAWRAEREAFAIDVARTDQLRRLVVDGMTARLDHEELRRTVSGYADDARTDPLTGLPNRVHLGEYIDGLVERAESGVVAVVEVVVEHPDSTSAQSGDDAVLQRVADSLMRIMRSGDFVARYGGAEFVLVLPGTKLSQTADVGRRVTRELDKEDWDLVSSGGTPHFDLGWADLSGNHEPGRRITGANTKADRIVARARNACAR
ncbi:GGDEF domain-containing protein [Stackebrandtia nassauensis]|uniref:Diguanylate cyclase n=1 Tax=Stackebrandtia nassauensis (strain DSM 44728 / CIP 108903 / NRRL B-16338 / NBRC 102104 / LLR-40K-21) TaxID=446470 RepID=D3PVP3_STANL|nr:diguanylate cyclase [Stackebrandtia nassauensis]ADD43157.1 diguanylate cyclase [Stackebrandtia nassauensis DSM 44728]